MLFTNVSILSDFIHDADEEANYLGLKKLFNRLQNLSKVGQISHIVMPSKSNRKKDFAYKTLCNLIRDIGVNTRLYNIDEEYFYTLETKELEKFLLGISQVSRKVIPMYLDTKRMSKEVFCSTNGYSSNTLYFDNIGRVLDTSRGDNYGNCKNLDFCPYDSQYNIGTKQSFELSQFDFNVPIYFVKVFFSILILFFLIAFSIISNYLTMFSSIEKKLFASRDIKLKIRNNELNGLKLFIFIYLGILLGLIFGLGIYLFLLDYNFVLECFIDNNFIYHFFTLLIIILIIPQVFYFKSNERQ